MRETGFPARVADVIITMRANVASHGAGKTLAYVAIQLKSSVSLDQAVELSCSGADKKKSKGDREDGPDEGWEIWAEVPKLPESHGWQQGDERERGSDREDDAVEDVRPRVAHGAPRDQRKHK